MFILRVSLLLATWLSEGVSVLAAPMDPYGWHNYGNSFAPYGQPSNWPGQSSNAPMTTHHPGTQGDSWGGAAAGSQHPSYPFSNEYHVPVPHLLDPASQPLSPDPEGEQAFLESILKDLEQDKHVAADAGHSSGAMPSNPAEVKDLYQNRKKVQVWSFRHRIEWPQPGALYRLPYLPPMKETKKYGKLALKFFDNDSNLQGLINAKVFGGHLRWLRIDEVPGLRYKLYRKTPVEHSSQKIPIGPVAPPEINGASHVVVHMTEHNLGQGPQEGIAGFLSDKPFYMFWGMPNVSPTGRNIVYSYGAGFLDKSHSEAVNNHLLPLLQAAESASRAHI